MDDDALAIRDAQGTFLALTPTLTPHSPPATIDLTPAGSYTLYCPLLTTKPRGWLRS